MIVILHFQRAQFALALRLGGGRSEFNEGFVGIRAFPVCHFERMGHGAAPGRRIELEENLQDAIRLEPADLRHCRRRLMNAGTAIEAQARTSLGAVLN